MCLKTCGNCWNQLFTKLKMSEPVEKKMKVDGEVEVEKEPKKLEDMLTRILASQQEIVELFIEVFKRFEKPGIKELWS